MHDDQELLPGAWLLQLKRLDDARGSFVKTYTSALLDSAQLSFDFKEEFYSVSARNVIRGMHFQVPPYDHVKLVYCPVGAVLDVLLDLRHGDTLGCSASVVLSAAQPALLFIPKGVAHGFKALQDGSLMVYKTSTAYAPSHDAGIHWDSFGFDWGLDQPPVISERDARHPRWADYSSPF